MKLAVKSVAVVAISLWRCCRYDRMQQQFHHGEPAMNTVDLDPDRAPTDGGNPDISGGKSLPANWLRCTDAHRAAGARWRWLQR